MNQLGLFAKFWQPGAVKTRLAASIGDVAACEVYYGFVQHLLNRLGASADSRSVVFSPSDRESDFRRVVPSNWNLCPQSGGDLGFRMNSFFQQQFASLREFDQSDESSESTSPKILVIGADCPQLAATDIQTALDLLDEAPVVIGPSSDGGYYLMGMRDQSFSIFDDIQWSTETVLPKTIEQLDAQAIDYRMLPVLTDVDDFDGLVALAEMMDQPTGQESQGFLSDTLKRKIRSVIKLGSNAESK